MLTVDFDRFPVGPGDRVLDMGCGGGRHAFALYRRGADVVALDLDEAELKDVAGMFAAMARRGRGRPTGATRAGRCAASAYGLPFADDSFDRVIAAEVLEHLPAGRAGDGRAVPRAQARRADRRDRPALAARAGLLGAVRAPTTRSRAATSASTGAASCAGGSSRAGLATPVDAPRARAARAVLVAQVRGRRRRRRQPAGRGLPPPAGLGHDASAAGSPGSPSGSLDPLVGKSLVVYLRKPRRQRMRRPELRDLPGVLTAAQLEPHRRRDRRRPAARRVDLPWPDGHTDPWDHVECAMALVLGGRLDEARAAYALAARAPRPPTAAGRRPTTQHAGARRRRSTSTSAPTSPSACGSGGWSPATASLRRRRCGRVVRRALDLVVRHAGAGRPDLLVPAAADGTVDPRRAADRLLVDLPGAALRHRAGRAASASRSRSGSSPPACSSTPSPHHPEAFLDKSRFSMDWYYPVLGGAVRGPAARRAARRATGTPSSCPASVLRCVSDRPWVTGAETAELALALAAVGEPDRARQLLARRAAPARRRRLLLDRAASSTRTCAGRSSGRSWTAAAMVLAADALAGGPTLPLFAGDDLPTGVLLPADACGPSALPSGRDWSQGVDDAPDGPGEGGPPRRPALRLDRMRIWSAPVRYAECDGQGVVFNSHYLLYADEALTEPAAGPRHALRRAARPRARHGGGRQRADLGRAGPLRRRRRGRRGGRAGRPHELHDRLRDRRRRPAVLPGADVVRPHRPRAQADGGAGRPARRLAGCRRRRGQGRRSTRSDPSR